MKKFGKTIIILNLLAWCSVLQTQAPPFSSPVLAAEQPFVHILCYHAFLEKKNPFCFSIDELKNHVRYYTKRGYRFVTVSDLRNGDVAGGNNILVTIDDGNKSAYRAYREVFKPRGIKPLLAIYPSIISKKKYALTWNQLKELSDDGCEIAAHGFYHRKINRRLYTKERKSFIQEIYRSKTMLEKHLNKEIDIFVYPYGIISDVTVHELHKAGYRLAFTIKGGGVSLSHQGIQKSYDLPRYMLTRNNWKWSFNQIVKKRAGSYSHYAYSEKKAKKVKPDSRKHIDSDKKVALVNENKEKKTAPGVEIDSVKNKIAALWKTVIRSKPGQKIVKNAGKMHVVRNKVADDDKTAARIKYRQEAVKNDREVPVEQNRDGDDDKIVKIPEPVLKKDQMEKVIPVKKGSILRQDYFSMDISDLRSNMSHEGDFHDRINEVAQSNYAYTDDIYQESGIRDTYYKKSSELKKKFNELSVESYKSYSYFMDVIKAKLTKARNAVRSFILKWMN